MARGNAGETAQHLRQKYPGAVPLTADSGTDIYKWTEAGQTLEGRFLRLTSGSAGGDLALMETESGIVSVSAPKMLGDALDGVKSGTRVAIQYLGDKQTKGGNTYKTFEVVALPETQSRR